MASYSKASISRESKARATASALTKVLMAKPSAAPLPYAFATGYLESMLGSIMAKHPSIHKEVTERVAELVAKNAKGLI